MRSKKSIKDWKNIYSEDQEGLYKNPFVRYLFDIGHKYIASRSKNVEGVVLDVGCGMGYHLDFETFTPLKKYICLDVDPKMLKKISNPNVSKLCADCESIPLKKESVDLIIASHILEHLPELDKSLKELNRILKKKASILVVLPCDPGFLWNFLTYFSPSRRRLKKIGLDYNEVMREEHINSFEYCKKRLEEHFVIDEIKYYPFGINNHSLNIICGVRLTKK